MKLRRRSFVLALAALPLALATTYSDAGRLIRGARIGGGSGDNAARIATALTGRTIPFAYNTPADPVTTSSATVNPGTIPGTLVTGRAYTLQAGSYGDITVDDDIDLICQSGVTIASLTVTGQRSRITGGGSTTITGTTTISVNATDFLMDNVHHGVVSLAEDGSLRRLAWINCTMRVTSGSAITGANGGQDIIWARCDNQNTDGTFWVKRVVGLTRMIDANCRWSTGAQQSRHHCTETNGNFPMTFFYIGGNQYESNGSHSISHLHVNSNNGNGDGVGQPMTDGWIEDCNFYRNDTDNGHCNVGNDATADMARIVVRRLRAFCGTTPGTPMGFINGSMADSTVEDCITAAFGSGAPAYPYGAN